MGASRIEQVIEDIYEFIESCKPQTFSASKVVVPKDELYDLLDELKLRTPDEIKRYQKIIANRDAIIADAETKAKAILAEAQEQTNALISESEIMQQAYQQANEIIEQANQEAARIIGEANEDANQIRTGALQYTEDMLTETENVLAHAYENTREMYENLLNTLRGNLQVVMSNKKEITDQLYGAAAESPSSSEGNSQTVQGQAAATEEEYNFDEDTFLKNID